MRTKLLKSFIIILGFWWTIFAVLWSTAQPATNLLSLQRVAHLARYIHFGIKVPKSISVLNALSVQLQVIHLWTVPVLVITLVMTSLGAGLVWLFALTHHKERKERIAKGAPYRGISVSLGALPILAPSHRAEIKLRSSDETLKSMSEQERALLKDVIGIIAANPDAFSGEHSPAGALLANTLNAVKKGLTNPHRPALAAIAAAASELGKITAWSKDEEGAWVKKKQEQRESARLLTALPSWWALPSADRTAILFAIKYRDQPENIPDSQSNPTVYKLTRLILETDTAEAQPQSASAQIKEKVYEQRDPATELLETFERELATLPFQSPGLPKNIPAVGWKKNGRAYFLENMLIDSLLGKLPPHAKSVLAPKGRDKTARISPITAALLRVFNAKGWLIVENGKDKVPPTEALWIITAGKLDFTRVIILELPAELTERLPAKDSYYEIIVKRPQFQSVVQSTVSKDDLMGGLLRPKTSATKNKKPEEQEKQDDPPSDAVKDG